MYDDTHESKHKTETQIYHSDMRLHQKVIKNQIPLSYKGKIKAT